MDPDSKQILLELDIDPHISPVMDYFEIFKQDDDVEGRGVFRLHIYLVITIRNLFNYKGRREVSGREKGKRSKARHLIKEM